MSNRKVLSKVQRTARDGRTFGRFAVDLPRFLRNTIAHDRCSPILKARLAGREDSFLRLLKDAVYAYPASPYARLLRAAGVSLKDVAESVAKDGIEASLGRLFDAGVYVRIEEFKGRRPIRRLGLELPVRASDFDNPLSVCHLEGTTGGSRGFGTRLAVDLDLVKNDALIHLLFLKAFQLEASPMALWRPLPPGVAGVKKALMGATLGKGIAHWFSQNEITLTSGNFKYFLFLKYLLHMSRLCGNRIPAPELVAINEPEKVADWLAQQTSEGNPGHLDTNSSSGVRVVQSAIDRNLDISGSFVRVGGEPYTAAKAQLIADAGCRAACHYSMTEVGQIGTACADPNALDDVHLNSHKMAVLQRPAVTDPAQTDAFYLTTLAPVCPKIMLNVSCGDSGVLERRECGCLLGSVGLNQHIHTIRSYEKLTSEGMQFLGSDLFLLLEEVLPSKFGGGLGDFQFVELEEAGVTKVYLIASNRLGDIDEENLLQTTLEFLASRAPENRMMVERWKEGNTLLVKRSEPYVTQAAKLLPLHVLPKDHPT